MSDFDRGIGRQAFGADPSAYDAGRPDYPPRVFDILSERCGLRAGARTFEVGPGTGKATRRLIERGARPLIGIEPDTRLASYLKEAFRERIEIQASTFEAATLPDEAFDLGVAATSFHWVEPGAGLAKVLRALKPGGSWAMWWNHYGDPDAPDALYQALQPLFAELPRQIYPRGRTPPLADLMARRTQDLRDAGFAAIDSEVIRWPLTLSTAGLKALYASFSELSTADATSRERFLTGLSRVADEQFGGQVERTWVTSIHCSRRPA